MPFVMKVEFLIYHFASMTVEYLGLWWSIHFHLHSLGILPFVYAIGLTDPD